MIDFELEPQILSRLQMFHAVSEHMMRPISRDCDEHEHTKPTKFYESMWQASAAADIQVGNDRSKKADGAAASAPRRANLMTVLSTEELCWGDAGLYLSTPNSGLGGAAVMAAGTPEQKERFLKRFKEGKPKWGAMAITEPSFGSDSSQVTTTATRDGDVWVINGTKIFCTAGQMAAEKSEGFVVVWATLDRKAGRAAIKPFVVEHNTPGMTVARVENKLGIRASDTAMLVFENCRVPADHLLGSPEGPAESATRGQGQVQTDGGGFKDVMATFDATRPIVAAMAIGVGRAALDFVRDFLAANKIPMRYGLSPRRLTTLERD